MLDTAHPTIGNRYHLLDKLGEGGMGAVYRAADRLTGQSVALKQVSLDRTQIDGHHSDFRYSLAQEFKTLASLHHPHIISVLDYGFARADEPFFTLELLENARSLVEYAQHKPLVQQVELLIQMLQALVYLHQRGIFHRDLKPQNVMIVHDQVKVLDFGLAIAREHVDPDSRPAGTLFYMAPELFAGTPASVASDLYAVGVMIYELLTGTLPFQSTSSTYALIYKIARTPPDDTPLLDHPLRAVVLRLMDKRPTERYASANAVIAALCDATGYPRPPESSAVRESFLQAARFVGRDAEFGILREALSQASAGHGSAWLIGGESGVGKSRLLDELRTQALVEGALVLRGQAIAEGGLPYQIWRSAVRRLSLQSNLSDIAAAVIKPVVPDIDRLIARDVPDSPLIDANSLQLRLFSTIESMFRQQRQLIVLLLEDLHWADDSLLLLRRLNELANESALLIIGTYRNDERPTLPADLPTLHHFTLDRLSPPSIELLSASMLGEVGKSAGVVDLLMRETEGNVFFIVEVVRALAEEAGQLTDIGRQTLPDHVFAGGMQAVIQRRLDKVPASARRLMIAAAVAGRQLDLNVLRILEPERNLEDWLQEVATVIEVRGNRYRFAHDKLREGILAVMNTSDRHYLHRAIARAIEIAYPNSTEHYAALAYHWGQAQDDAKTVANATLAGQQSLRSGSYREAIQFFQQALPLAERVPLNRRELADLNHLVGDAYWGQSDIAKSRVWHAQALRILGYSLPETPRQLALGSLKPLAKHLARRLFRVQRQAANWEELLVVAGSYDEIVQGTYHEANLILGVFCIFNGMDAAEQTGDSRQAARIQARYYSLLGFALGDIALHGLARSYMKLAESRVRTASDPQTFAWFDFLYGLYLAGRGQWKQSNRLIEESMELSKGAGSLGLWVETVELYPLMLGLQSRFDDALAAVESAVEVTQRDDNIGAIGWFHLAKSRLLFLQGKTREASAHYFNNQAAIDASRTLGNQIVMSIGASGLLTELYTRDEAWDKALKSAEALNALVKNAQTVSVVLAGQASASIALYLTLWEKQADPAYAQLAFTMLKQFHQKYARRYDVGRPLEAMYRCWYHWLNGNEQQARKAGALAIQAAQTYQMPYDEASARYQLARFMAKDDPERSAHLQTAVRLFNTVGAAYDAERASHSL